MKLKISTRRVKQSGNWADKWEGLLRDEKGKLVWACGHQHFYRSGSFNDATAQSCASFELEQRKAANA